MEALIRILNRRVVTLCGSLKNLKSSNSKQVISMEFKYAYRQNVAVYLGGK